MCVALAFAKAVLSICSAPHLCFPTGAVGLGHLNPPQAACWEKENSILKGEKQMKKRLLSTLLALCMVLTFLPSVAYAEDTAYAVKGGYIYFNANTGTITGCDDSVTEAVIPSSINGITVTGIGSDAFSDISSLAHVTIPQGVTSIAAGAFSYCENLKNIEVDDENVWYYSIDGVLFRKYGLSSSMANLVCYPAGKTATQYEIPNNVNMIVADAFWGCHGLRKVIITDNVEIINGAVFAGCINLEEIEVTEGNKNFSSIDGVLFNKAKTILQLYPEGRESVSYNVPSSVTSIVIRAFGNCQKIKNVVLPDSVTHIYRETFYYCKNLETISFSPNTMEIGEAAFYECSSLKNITIPESVTNIDDFAFAGCSSLTNVTIPGNVIHIGTSAFNNCTGLTKVVLKDGIPSIGAGAFGSCVNLTNIVLPNSLITIGSNAFGGCTSLTEIDLPDGVKTIGAYAFSNCSNLAKITMPNSVTDIGDYAFQKCAKLVDVTLSNGLITIGGGAFEACDSLSNITLPGSLIKIDAYAFSNCNNLTSVIFSSGIASIGGYAFRGCSDLSDITIPLTVTCVEEAAFYECPGIKDIYYEGSEAQWKEVEIRAWNNGLTSATIHYNNYSDNSDRNNGSSETSAEGLSAVERELTPAKSKNKNNNNYTIYASTVKSYLYQEGDNLTRVEYIDGCVIIETYSSDFVLISSYGIEIASDAKWGGFFAGQEYNFIILGWDNKEKNDSATVLRIVKYDKSWKCLGQVDLYNADTVIPFEAGSLRCDECDGILYIHTSHEMYNGHQSNMTVTIREYDMLITSRSDSELRQFYVSHSFNQFILVDQEHNVITLDHGDAYPRAAYLQQSGTSKRKSVAVQSFPGATGDNTTGASIGGLAETSNAYVLVYNYNGLGGAPEEPGIEWNRSPDPSRARNIYICYTSKNDFSKSGTMITQLTNYNVGNSYTVSTPVLAPTGLSGGYVLWREYDKENSISYVSYFDNGTVSGVNTVIGSLSDCQPIEYQGKVVWYVTDNSAPTFYILDETGLTTHSTKLFDDVPSSAYYADAVAWAVENKVTSGTGDGTTFSPDDPCTRAQIVTFLWRAYGSQEPVSTTNPFTDVNSNDYYYKAVLWAVENKITSGATATTFNPEGICTRKEAVTFQYRAAGSPPVFSGSSFTDVPDGEWYSDAVAWAVDNGITSGTGNGTTFSPNQTCTRSQIVTFLYREIAK